MLLDLYKYSGIHSKMKGMSRGLLTEEDYIELLGKKSVIEIALYLESNTSYKTALKSAGDTASIHRGELEKILQKSFEDDFVKLMKFENGGNKEFLRIYILRYEIELLKVMLRMLENNTLNTFERRINEYFLKSMTIDVDKLKTSHNLPQFIENLKGSVYSKLLSPFIVNTEHLNLFSIEMSLDVYYFKRVWKLKDKLLSPSDALIVKQTFGSEVDLLNILWIIRCKKYFNTPKELIYSFIVPINYRLRREQLKPLVEAETADEVLLLLEKTRYKGLFNRDDLFLEQYYLSYVARIFYRKSRLETFSIMSSLGYLHIKEIEMTNIIKIIEGVRYSENIREIKGYVIGKGGGSVGG